MREIIKTEQEIRAQNILKLLRYRGPMTVAGISLYFQVAPRLIDKILSELHREERVKTEDYIFWELGPKPRVTDGYDVEPIAPYLVVLCGPSHSGKSTFAKKFCKGFKVISSDKIREHLKKKFRGRGNEHDVWEAFSIQKREAMRDGYDIVLDACNMSARARGHALENVNSRYKKICIVFDLPLKTIRDRCIKTKRIPLEEAERMWRAFNRKKPTIRELGKLGFWVVHILKD